MLLLYMYLWILKSEVTHIVIDQTEAKAPVHDRQAPLRRKEVTSVWAETIRYKYWVMFTP